jgi:hypothetical protein
MTRALWACVVWLVASGTVGCAVPLASMADDVRMKQYVPAPDRALIYLYRNESGTSHMTVSLDGGPYRETAGQTYMVWEVPPGPHFLISKAQKVSTLLLQTDPGRRYFVWQREHRGYVNTSPSQLLQVPEEAGVIGVRECQLIAMPLPP